MFIYINKYQIVHPLIGKILCFVCLLYMLSKLYKEKNTLHQQEKMQININYETEIPTNTHTQ
jgi:hypothetical protein